MEKQGTVPEEKQPRFWERLVVGAGRKMGRREEARLFVARFYHESPGLRRLKDCGRGKRCFVVGNGPSLNKLNLDKLPGEDTFCVNGIFLKFPETSFRPTYYVVEDSLVAEDRAEQINNLRGMKKIFPTFLKTWLTPDEDTTFAHVICDYSSYRGFPHFSTDAARCMWVGGTVTYVNLQLAFYFGYDPVVLIGIDHNYEVKKAEIVAEGNTFTSTVDDHNHFHADYFGKGYRYHDPRPDRMEVSYRKANRVFKRYGRKILNATAGGRLEVFERIDYDSLF